MPPEMQEKQEIEGTEIVPQRKKATVSLGR